MSPEFVPSPEFLARTKRVQDAVELKQPDRIPINLGFGYFLAEYGGITRQEQHDDPEKTQKILEELLLKLEPDMAMGAWGTPEPSKILGDQMTKWPGYRLGPQGSFQFDEHEFMKAEDYDAFLNDPSDFAIRKYLPRAFKELEALAMLPPMGMALYGYYNTVNIGALTLPPIVAAFQKIAQAAQAQAEFTAWQMESAGRMAALGFPGPTFIIGSLIEAPFDFMSDTLRGMRGIFLDMLRIPDKLLEAEQRVLKIQLEHALSFAAATGLKAAFIPLHRGSDGFMSLKHFEKFYWPQLKEMIVRLVEAGITPSMYYEGVWDDRLEYLTELPKGKTVGFFQDSNIFKVKEVVGDTLCIVGGMPNSLLVGGTVEQVRQRTKEVCECVGKGGGFIMGTGVLELEGSKMELVEAWVQATREFGVY
ncbi:MAG: hypothetical protein H6657_01650 [Ardenticatenaceae bacterium]|nr:hypothetical protein [Ardenticatenaceae bacterium]